MSHRSVAELARRCGRIMLAATGGFLISCGGDGGGPTDGRCPHRAPFADSAFLAVLIDSTYVSYDESDPTAEGSNLVIALQCAGFAVDTFSGIDPTTLTAQLFDGHTFGFVIPGLRDSVTLRDSLTGPARSVVRVFGRELHGGIFTAGGNAYPLMNTLFGYTVTTPGVVADSTIPYGQLTNVSVFADGPDVLLANRSTSPMHLGSIPTGSDFDAEAYFGNATVAVFTGVINYAPSGSGGYGLWYHLAWNWGRSDPASADGGWQVVLERLHAAFVDNSPPPAGTPHPMGSALRPIP